MRIVVCLLGGLFVFYMVRAKDKVVTLIILNIIFMNEKIDLTKILKDCPKGTKFYSVIYGEVEFDSIEKGTTYPVIFITKCNNLISVMSDGRHVEVFDGLCTLFPSKDQRDWSKFTAPWYKKEREKFDPKTLQPFDKVLVRNFKANFWICKFLSHIQKWNKEYPYVCSDESSNRYCIPYNEDTKHLVGTNDEAPEYYRYWEG